MVRDGVDEAVTTAIKKVEAERCRALKEQNWPVLESILSEDYTQVHNDGSLVDRSTYFKDMKGHSFAPVRGPLSVRVYGDSAVMMGTQTSSSERSGQTHVSNSQVMQVWVNRDGWKLVAQQNTRLP